MDTLTKHSSRDGIEMTDLLRIYFHYSARIMEMSMAGFHYLP